MAGEGMVAVMQGLRDCGLAVALLDEDGKTYTLVPKPVDRKTTSTGALPSQCDAGAQATDGRFATVYRVHHCKMTPTSPPDHLPEFPPQRAEVYPGHDNFEVGGTGSGETYIPVKSSCYRGGMCWTDRGSVCSPRPSRDPDAFASSLRKYPASPDRSAEMVERLINYSQHNNCNRPPHRHYSPPCRTCEHMSSYSSSRSSRHGYEPEVFMRRQRSPEEYPTRERRGYEAEMYSKPTYGKNGDVRIIRDLSKRLKDSIKSMSLCVEAPCTITEARDRREIHPLENSNVVNTEIQAAASMVSRKVCTVPQPVPIRRTVAVPLSPASSHSGRDAAARFLDPSVTRSVQTIRTGTSVHTSTSYTDATNKVMVTRKSKSFTDFAVDKDLKTEILEWLDDSDPKMKKLQDSVLRKLNRRLKIPSMKERLKDEAHDNFKRTANELHRMHAQCCYVCKSAEILRNDKSDENFDVGVREWINDISVKIRDLLRPGIKKQVYNTFVKRLKQSAAKTTLHREQALRTEILLLLKDLPIDYQGFSKRIYLNTLVDALMTKMDNISELTEGKHVDSQCIDDMIPQSSKCYSESSVKERRIEPEKTLTKTTINGFQKTGTVFSDVFKKSNDEDNSGKDNSHSDEVTALLNNVTKLPEETASELAMQLEEILKGKRIEKEHVMETQPTTVLLLQDNSRVKLRDTHEKILPKVNRVDLDYLDSSKYMSHLAGQIEEWLSNLKIAQEHNEELRHAVVNDLANDIIDRQKYLELSQNRCTDIDELEHLKYQIFKWINKLVGEDNTETIEHASELMQRIKNIPVSGVSTQSQEISTKSACVGCRLRENEEFCDDYTKNRSGNGFDSLSDKINHVPISRHVQTVFTAASNSQLNLSQKAAASGLKNNSNCCLEDSGNKSNLANSANGKPSTSALKATCCQGPPLDSTSIRKLNEEYESFVSNWVKELPISSSTPEEAAVVEKARLGIENGIWKAITKIKFDPATLHNKFLYEDLLEEEIDALLDLLPQTPDFQKKRHLLKVKLIEKTSETNELILAAVYPETYKHQLVHQVSSNLPRRDVYIDDEDPTKLFEEMLIICIAEDFILSTKYKDEDKVKANAYRNKVVKKIEAIIEEVKRTSGKEAKDFDTELYVNDVISALHKVPLPTEETIRQEADEILLGLEIEQWFNDLPLVKNDERTEQLHRRRLRDALTKKLHELEKEVNIADCTGEPQFKHEISEFLHRLPLEKNERLDIIFMVDELVNRMRNRERAVNRRKSVAFQDGQEAMPQRPCNAQSSRLQGRETKMSRSGSQNLGQEFDTFTKDVPACSSMINPPPGPVNQHDPVTDNKKWGLDPNRSEKQDFWDSKGNIKESSKPVYVPGQFKEKTLGGRFGYGPRGEMLMSNQSTMGTFLDNQGNLIASTPHKQQPGPAMYHDQPSSFNSYQPQMNPAMGSMHAQQMPHMDIPSDEFVSIPYASNPPNMHSFVPAPPPGQDYSQRGASPSRHNPKSQPPGTSFAKDRFANQEPTMGSFFDNQGNLKSSTPYQSQMNPAMGSMHGQQIPQMDPSGEYVSIPYDSNPPPMHSFLPASQPQPYRDCSQRGDSPSREYPKTQPPVASFANRPNISQDQPSMYSQGTPNFTMPELPSFRRYNEPAPQAYEPSNYISLHDSKPMQPRQSSQRLQLDSQQLDHIQGRSGFNNTQASPCQNPHHEQSFAPQASFANRPDTKQASPCKNPCHRPPSPPVAEQSFEPPGSFVEDRFARADTTQGQVKPNVTQADGMRTAYPSMNHSKQGQVDPNGSKKVQMINREGPQTVQNRSLPPTPTMTNSDAFYGHDPRFLAPYQPTGLSISNQPVGFSTPNQLISNAQPPNIKERRQIEKKSRRVDSGTDDDGEEVRVRCHCVDRYDRRCKRRPQCTCNNCLGYPYFFPMGCTHPYFFNGC